MSEKYVDKIINVKIVFKTIRYYLECLNSLPKKYSFNMFEIVFQRRLFGCLFDFIVLMI